MKLHLKWDETPKLNLLLYNKINSTLSFLIQNVLGQNTEGIITAKNSDTMIQRQQYDFNIIIYL